jgi:hypothetical protein
MKKHLVDVHRSFAMLRMTILFSVLFLCGCRTVYVPLEVVRYDSIVFVSMDRDSVFVRDSVFLREKGDTVFKYKDRFVYVYRDRVDTFYMEKMREVEVPVPVERKLTWWERVKLEYAEWLIGVLVAIALVYAIRKWMARKVRKE